MHRVPVLLIAALLACASSPKIAPVPSRCEPGRDKNGKIARSAAARAAFTRAVPCPATQKQSGSCPGWEVHHHVPLYCCGPDTPENMRWIRVEDHDAIHTEDLCD
jgi:hypothetical protein